MSLLETDVFGLLENTTDAAYLVTEDGKICSGNAAAEALFGHPASEVLRRNIDEGIRNPGGYSHGHDLEDCLAAEQSSSPVRKG